MDLGINNAIASTTHTVTTDFVSNVPSIVVIFGSLVALGLLIALVKKLIHNNNPKYWSTDEWWEHSDYKEGDI